MSKLSYITWIEENFNDIIILKEEHKKWSAVYKNHVFAGKWPHTIEEILNGLKTEIKRNLDECQYYLNRIKEMESQYDQTGLSQLIKDEEDALSQGGESRDTAADTTRVE